MTASVKENLIVERVIKRLSSCKYFSGEHIVTAVDQYVLEEKARNRVIKKVVRTLGRLGYRDHVIESGKVSV